jgi:predicted transcriptional regulator
MAFLSALPGIFSSIVGGPLNIIKSIGSAVGGLIQGIREHKSFGDIIGGTLQKGISTLTGTTDESTEAREAREQARRETIQDIEVERAKLSLAKEAQVLQDKRVEQPPPFFTNTSSVTREATAPFTTNTNAVTNTSEMKREKIPAAFRNKMYPYQKSGLSKNAIEALLVNKSVKKHNLANTSKDLANEYDDEYEEEVHRPKKKGKKFTKKMR